MTEPNELPGSQRKRPADAATREPVAVGAELGEDDAPPKTARCADCGAMGDVPAFVWAMALEWHRKRTAAGREGLRGVGRCEPCGRRWRQEQQAESERRHERDVALFRRLRQGLAAVKAGSATRAQIAAFVRSLPDDFASDHNDAVQSFRTKAEALFAKGDTEATSNDWDTFPGAA